jgi:hypothetical protein
MNVPIVFPFAILFNKEKACPGDTSRISYGIADPSSRPIPVKTNGRNGGKVYRRSAAEPFLCGYHRVSCQIKLPFKNEFASFLHGVIVKNRNIRGWHVFQAEREGPGLM